MNQTVILIVMGAAVLLAILVPLLRGGQTGTGAAPRGGTRRLADAPDVPDPLAELELDYQMGRLTEEDYEALREKALAGTAVPAVLPDDGEAEGATPVARAPAPRTGKGVPKELDERAEAMIRRQRARLRASCPNCGDRPEPGAKFCSNCGQELAACPACGHRLDQPDARFCPECGTALGA